MAFTKVAEVEIETVKLATRGRGLRVGNRKAVLITYTLGGGTTASGNIDVAGLKRLKGVLVTGASGVVALSATVPNRFSVTGMGVEAAGVFIAYGSDK